VHDWFGKKWQFAAVVPAMVVTHWLWGTTAHPTPGQQQAPWLGGQGFGLALHDWPGKNGLPAGQLAAEVMMQPPEAVSTQQAPFVGQGLAVAVQETFGMNVPFIALHSLRVVMMQVLFTQQTPLQGLAAQVPLSVKMPTLVGQLEAETGARQLPLSRLQHEPDWPQTTVEQTLPAPNQGLLAHWACVTIWQPPAAVQHAPVGKHVMVVQAVLAYQVPLQAFCTVCVQAAPGRQQAPVETQGLGEQVTPGYHVLVVGHCDCGTLVAHPPVAALQHAPVVVVLGHGLGWQAVEPPPT
jgi:hypothetical protein